MGHNVAFFFSPEKDICQFCPRKLSTHMKCSHAWPLSPVETTSYFIHIIQTRTRSKLPFPSRLLLRRHFRYSFYIFPRYAGWSFPLFTNFGVGFTIVSIDGPFVVTRDIIVAFSFITARCRILLYFPLLRICHKHIDVKMFIYFY